MPTKECSFIGILKFSYKINPPTSTLNPVRPQVVIIVRHLGETRFEKLLHGVGVPLGNRKCLLHLAPLVHQLHDRIEAAHVLDGQIRKLERPVTLDEGLNLRVRAKLARAHLEDGLRVNLELVATVGVLLAALAAVVPADGEGVLC